jgi:hypothetical protein
MKNALSLTVLALVLWGCGGGDGPSQTKVATSVSVAPVSVTFDAVGATQVVKASVRDQNGGVMTGVPLSWSSSSASATVVGAGGDSAIVTAAANGTASITATAGAASGAASVQVAQVAKVLEKVAGDLQAGPGGAALPIQVRVRVLDRLNAPVAGQTVTFAVTQGGGSLNPASVVTGADGAAATTWTLGGSGAQSLSATVGGTNPGSVQFGATAVAGPAATVSVNAGNVQGAMVATAVPVRPSVVIRDAGGLPIPGRTVTFAVAGGGGSVTGATATTDASGVATVGSWTLGPAAGPNFLTATVQGGGVADNPVTFSAVGCEGSGAGYEITLCFITPMSTAQRAAFENAATRWSGLITADVIDAVGQVPAGTCGDASPSLDMTYDDLVIFAAVEDIDGPSSVLGQAGWCYRRSGGLPVIGLMLFDAADMASLESSGQLGDVILHEMGHVLGIGSFWATLGLLQNAVTTNGPVLDTHYTGANGIAGFDAIGGSTYTGGAKVPVENTGGQGTANSHWRESVLKNELMTGFLGAGSNPLSAVTVRSLADLGYTVNAAGADAFFLTLSLRGQRSGAETAIRLENDEWKGPRYSIDRQGRRTRLR